MKPDYLLVQNRPIHLLYQTCFIDIITYVFIHEKYNDWQFLQVALNSISISLSLHFNPIMYLSSSATTSTCCFKHVVCRDSDIFERKSKLNWLNLKNWRVSSTLHSTVMLYISAAVHFLACRTPTLTMTNLLARWPSARSGSKPWRLPVSHSKLVTETIYTQRPAHIQATTHTLAGIPGGSDECSACVLYGLAIELSTPNPVLFQITLTVSSYFN
jgi:hypothetical protein